MTKAIFLDRDGTLIDEPETEVVDTWDKFKIHDDIQSLASLTQHGFLLFIVSNQEGIGEGTFDEKFYNATNTRLLAALHKYGIKIKGIYTCPHPQNGSCNCRKPKPGLIDQAFRDHPFQREQSLVIGDRMTDVALAHAAGMKSVFLETNRHVLSQAKPDYIANTLQQAVVYILQHQ